MLRACPVAVLQSLATFAFRNDPPLEIHLGLSAMHPANINDPSAVKALLDQLRVSRAWQDTLSSSVGSEHHSRARESPPSTPEDVQGESTTQPSHTAPQASVASLLSQLRAAEWTPTATDTPVATARESSRDTPRPSHELPSTPSEHRTPRPVATSSSTQAEDIRHLTFQQALPHLTRLASDPDFLAAVSRLRQEQNELERQLWEERQAIHKKHEERVKVARTKATLIGAGLSRHEADMMNDAYRRDLQRFDRERVLLAWGVLVQKQQSALETLGVPTMFPTTSRPECQTQQKIVQVLEGL